MATFECRVVSASEELFSGEITLLVAASTTGELGIMANHTPLITLLKPGTMHIKNADGNEELIYISGGVLEVQPKVVTVLADSAVRASDLDEAKVLESRKLAEQMLENQSDTVQTGAALHAMAESLAQIQTINKFRNRA